MYTKTVQTDHCLDTDVFYGFLEDTCMTGRGLEMSRVLVVLAQSQWKMSASRHHPFTPCLHFHTLVYIVHLKTK